MNSLAGRTKGQSSLGVAAALATPLLSLSAQVQAQTSTKTHSVNVTINVDQGEVAFVSGNNLMVKNAGWNSGALPPRPVQRADQTVTTVQNMTGKVWHVSPPHGVILRLDDGTNQQFKIPKDQKFNVNGQMTDAWGLRKGM